MVLWNKSKIVLIYEPFQHWWEILLLQITHRKLHIWWNRLLCSSQAGKYEESLKHLDALQELNKEDYKIALNKSVVEFYKSGQSTTGTLKQTLVTMKNQVTVEMLIMFV